MTKAYAQRERLSIDILSQEHKQIKVYAALHGMTIREYVLSCLREHLRQENERTELSVIINFGKDPVLEELWNNEKDSLYDKL